MLSDWISKFYKKKSREEVRAEKRSPTEIIENTNNPKVEHAYVKIPGKEMMEVTLNRSESTAQFSSENIRPLLKEKSRKRISKRPHIIYVQYYPYTRIHTHPYDSERAGKLMLPSHYDFIDFFDEGNVKTMMIAQQDIRTGKVMGYFILRKTKKTPRLDLNPQHEINDMPKLDQDFLEYMRQMTENKENKPANALRNFAQKYHLNYRFVPARYFRFDESTASFKKKGLEDKVSAAIAIIGLMGSILFLSTSLTGNAIGINQSSSSLVGAIFLCISLIGAFFYFGRR